MGGAQGTARRYLQVLDGRRLAVDVGGDPAAPAIVLLHGFPSSARTFRRLAPMLAGEMYVIAPDLPGYGESDVLDVTSFERMGEAIVDMLDQLGVGRRFIWLHDYGAPVGLHLAMHAPDQVAGLIVQNANAHETGFGPQWAATRAYWDAPTPRNEAEATAHLTAEGIRDQYVAGVPDRIARQIDPTTWEADWRAMTLTGRLEAQRALVKDYGAHARRFPEIAAWLKTHQPSALMVWGRHDTFFDLAETQSWMEDLPAMDAHILDGAHFLLETRANDVALLVLDFVRRQGA